MLTDPYGLVPSSGVHVDIIAEAVTKADINSYAYTDESLAFHREIFADGEVTRSEYERAVFAAAECMRELGYEIEGPFQYGPNTGAGFSPGLDPSVYFYYWAINAGTGFDNDIEHCQQLWEHTIGAVWLTINAPTETEVRMWLQAAWDCLRERNLPISEPPTEDDAIDSVSYGCEPWNALPER